jgi:hypothetical protein
MRLCVVTDEISQDLAHALDVCEDEGLSTVELRAVDGANIVSHDDASLEKLQAIVEDRGFRVGSIASPLLKCHLHGDGDPQGVTHFAAPASRRISGGSSNGPSRWRTASVRLSCAPSRSGVCRTRKTCGRR